jgi:hypothetical protein
MADVKLPRYSWGELGGPGKVPGYCEYDAGRGQQKVDFMKEGVTFKQSTSGGSKSKSSDGYVDGSIDKGAKNFKEKY